MKVRIKENGTLFSEGMKWKIQYLLKLKTHLVSFVFGFRCQIWQKQKQKIQVYGGFRTRQICLSSSFCLIMGRGVGELSGL